MVASDILRRHAALRPDEPAIITGERTITFRELRARAHRVANALRGLDVGRGDRVAVLAHNCREYVELYFANGLIGAVTTPLNYRLTPAELEYVINDSEATVVVVGADLVPVVAEIRTPLPTVRHYVSIGGRHAGYLDYEDWLAAASDAPPGVEVSETDLLWQMYTSGTTVRPKGAMISHRALLTNVGQISQDFGIRLHDRFLVVAPLYHAAAAVNGLTVLAMGGALVVKTGFDPGEVLRSIGTDGVTIALLVPAMILALLNTPGVGDADMGRLRTMVYGASPIPVEVLRRAIETFRCGFIQGYGQTEASAVLTVLPAADHVLDGPAEKVRRLQSCGREVYGCEVRVVDENDADVRPGEIGEVIARGGQLMSGYWKMPEATAATLRGGWLRTGDLATVDEERYIFIMDRLKDMIVSGGENVYPREIEEVLFAHPAVADAACIGVPSERWGEEAKAIVVLKPDRPASEADLIAFCDGRLAGFKRPRSVEFRSALPKNPSGKVLKRELREPYWRDKARRVN